MSHPGIEVGPSHPYHAEETSVPYFDIASVPEEALDAIPADEVLPAPTPAAAAPDMLPLPRVVLGCAPFGFGIYAEKDASLTTMPVRIVRAALRAGVNAFDTAPHYHASEIVLGNALHTLRDEFPRSSYSIITKVAKYGAKISNHDYDPDVTRAAIERSLKRFKTDYLDVVYLHDIEFESSKPYPAPAGHHLEALVEGSPAAEQWGLTEPYEPLGDGDRKILACLAVLREYQAAGKVKRIGIASYPLPTMLRISLMALHVTGKPLDVIQNYSHETLQCSTLRDGFLDALTQRAKVGQVCNAAPLSMGLLTTGGGPAWHFAREVPPLYQAARDASDLALKRGTTLEAAAIAYGYKPLTQHDGTNVPVVVGCTTLEQLHQTLQTYRDVATLGKKDPLVEEVAAEVVALFKARGVHNFSWQSPPASAS